MKLERATKKVKRKTKHVWEDYVLLHDYQYSERFASGLGSYIIDKLGAREDIEDELGIDLVTLKTAQKGFYSKYFDSYVKPIRIVIFEEATRPYIEVHHNKMTKLIFIDEYGKTWALTKEELEEEE